MQDLGGKLSTSYVGGVNYAFFHLVYKCIALCDPHNLACLGSIFTYT